MKYNVWLKIIFSMLFMIMAKCILAQNDSIIKTIPSIDTLNDYRIGQQEMQDIETATTNPVWFILTKIAPVFNIGVYYSYLSPLGEFKQRVSPSSAFSFDIGMDLTRIFGNNESDWHMLIGMNADYTNFGVIKKTFTNGDTTYNVKLKNSLEVYSYYFELEYRRSFICPFGSVAYSTIFLNPYKENELVISNATTHTSETSGDYLANEKAHGVNLGLGVKCKYRFNDHKELMLIAKANYLYSSSIRMPDMSSANISGINGVNYSTITVNPTWMLFSIGVKYNF
jgi:hypothetical protein